MDNSSIYFSDLTCIIPHIIIFRSKTTIIQALLSETSPLVLQSRQITHFPYRIENSMTPSDIAPTQVSISTTYPGASAQTLEDSVTQVIEQKMQGLDHLQSMLSTSSSNGQVQRA